VYHLNFSTRYGSQCVTEDTDVLTPTGFKKYNELKEGDSIYTWKDGVCEIQPILKMNVYDYDGEMHEYSGRDINQTITPDHRLLYKTGSNDFTIKNSSEVIDNKSPIYIPVAMKNNNEDYPISDEMLEMLVFILTDGNVDKEYNKIKFFKSKTRWGIDRFKELCEKLNYTYSHSITENKEWKSVVQIYNLLIPATHEIGELLNWTKKELPSFFTQLSSRQANLVIDTWLKLDGNPSANKTRLQVDNDLIQNQLQHVCFLAEKSSRATEYMFGENKTPTKYVYIYSRQVKAASNNKRIHYKGKVWCPSTLNGVVVFRKEGKLFISGNCPFSNITLDITVPEDMKDELALIAGKPIKDFYDYTVDGIRVNNHTYGDLWEWQRLVAEAFIDTFNEGDKEGKSFTFPVLTLNVEESFFDHPLTNKICKFTAKYGIPFFQNFINGKSGEEKMDPRAVRAMCCRLNLNLAEITNTTGGLFGNSDGTGSLMVVTINLPYIAKESAGDMEVFNNRLKYVMEKVRELHLWKREKVNSALESGFLALSKKTLPKGFDTFFTTVGFIGLWECVEILNKDENSLLTEEGLALGETILRTMTRRTKQWVDQYKALWNLEETPAESASYKLAQKSLKQFPDINHRGLKKAPYFTNGCNIPVEYQDDLMQVLRVRTRLQAIPNGGTATHFYIGEEWGVEETKEFIKAICQTSIPYFSISTVYSICPICGYKVGAHEICPNKHTAEQINWLRNTHPELIIE
jgi:ribonucleoside-triphosphate reductase